jgi:hypothetical protein
MLATHLAKQPTGQLTGDQRTRVSESGLERFWGMEGPGWMLVDRMGRVLGRGQRELEEPAG